jgi:protocatechuate 3,4-dioxygenase beta subunit
MRFPTRPALLIFALLLGAVFSNAAAQTAQKQGTGIITGRITFGEKPGANVAVVLFSAERTMEQRGPVGRTTTDYDGRYRFSGVPAGRYSVVPVAPVMVGPNEGTFGGQGKAITIDEGETVEKIDFALVRGGVITGRVTDGDGNPIISERVQLSQPGKQDNWRFYNSNPFMYMTDDRGIYRIYGLAPGKYLVSVGEAGTESVRFGYGGRGYYTRTFHPNVTEESKATLIEITEGSEASNVDITLGRKAKSFTASGRAVDESGKPVAGVPIGHGAVTKEGNRMGAFGWGNVSDSEGRFRLEGLLPGRYAAFIWNEGDTESYSDTAVFEITEGDVSGLEVKLRRGASISGVAVIEGTTDRAALAKLSQLSLGASVESKGLNAPKFDNVKISPDGSFRLGGLQPGKVRLYLATYPPPKGFTLARIERDGVAVQDFDLAPGAQVTGLRVVFEHGTGSIRGQVKLENGPLPTDARMGISIRRRNDTAGHRGAQVDSRGRFLIEGMAAGEYELTLHVFVPGVQPPRFPRVKQNVVVASGIESEVNFTLDLNAKQPEGENNE